MILGTHAPPTPLPKACICFEIKRFSIILMPPTHPTSQTMPIHWSPLIFYDSSAARPSLQPFRKPCKSINVYRIPMTKHINGKTMTIYNLCQKCAWRPRRTQQSINSVFRNMKTLFFYIYVYNYAWRLGFGHRCFLVPTWLKFGVCTRPRREAMLWQQCSMLWFFFALGAGAAHSCYDYFSMLWFGAGDSNIYRLTPAHWQLLMIAPVMFFRCLKCNLLKTIATIRNMTGNH